MFLFPPHVHPSANLIFSVAFTFHFLVPRIYLMYLSSTTALYFLLRINACTIPRGARRIPRLAWYIMSLAARYVNTVVFLPSAASLPSRRHRRRHTRRGTLARGCCCLINMLPRSRTAYYTAITWLRAPFSTASHVAPLCVGRTMNGYKEK